MKITKLDSIIFSIIKWEFMMKYDFEDPWTAMGELVDEYPLIENIVAHCGFCERHIRGQCHRCPLKKKNVCSTSDSLSAAYWKWYYDPTKENAKVMYDAILEVANEYEQKED